MEKWLSIVLTSMRHLQSNSRNCFSLLEVMIVVILVALIGGGTLFSLKSFYQTYRFRLEVDTLYELMQELQLEALTLQSDMTIRLIKEKGKWVAQTFTDESVLKPQTIHLPHIETITCPSLTITLYSNGLIEPSDVVTFSYQNEKRGLDLRFAPLIKFWENEPQKFEYQPFPSKNIGL